MKQTSQEKFWSQAFGKEYIRRNPHTPNELDRLYMRYFGTTRTAMNKTFIKSGKQSTIVEVGCNVGAQLRTLENAGFKHLYGIEINEIALSMAKKNAPKIQTIYGSALDIPFKDAFADIVFTSGVLIHISPTDIASAMEEIHRVSKRYIWGFEYYAPEYQSISYRGNKNRLWKAPFADMYLKRFPDLRLVREKKYTYRDNKENQDSMFLLEKTQSSE